jgi:hypothetical protein
MVSYFGRKQQGTVLRGFPVKTTGMQKARKPLSCWGIISELKIRPPKHSVASCRLSQFKTPQLRRDV